jgi:glycosyltransferase involved in cell wall biosynthesis
MQVKLSIITVVRNDRFGIETTIQSVISQDYPFLEYIIVDGNSSDGTLDVINSYREKVTKIISEIDQNLYDAINKGISLSTGDYIGLLHSGDKYFSNSTLSYLVNNFNDVDLCLSNMIILDSRKKIILKPDFNYLKKNMRLNHPTWFLKREIFTRFGLYDINFKIAADYDFALRIFTKVKYCYVNINSVLFSLNGLSYNNFSVLLESFYVRKKNNKNIISNSFILFQEVLFLIFYKFIIFLRNAIYNNFSK